MMGNLGVITWLVHLLKVEESSSNDSIRCAAADALVCLAIDDPQNQSKILENVKDSPLLNMMDRSGSERLSALLLKLISIIIYKKGEDPHLEAYFIELERPWRLTKLVELCLNSSREIVIESLGVLVNFCQSCRFRPEVDLPSFVVSPLSQLLNSEDEAILLLTLRIISHCMKKDGIWIVLQEGEIVAKEFKPVKNRGTIHRKMSIQSTWSQRSEESRKGIHQQDNLFQPEATLNSGSQTISKGRSRTLSNAGSSILSMNEISAIPAGVNAPLEKSSSHSKIESGQIPKLSKKSSYRHLGVLPFRPFVRLVHLSNPKIASKSLGALSVLVQREASVNGNIQSASNLLIDNGFVQMLTSKLFSKDVKELSNALNVLQYLAKNEKSIEQFKTFQSFNVVTEILKTMEKYSNSNMEIFKHSSSLLISLISFSEDFLRILGESKGINIICKIILSIPLPEKIIISPSKKNFKFNTKEIVGLDEALSLLEVYSIKVENSAEILRECDAIRAISNILIRRTDIPSGTRARGEKVLNSLGDGLEPRHRIAFEIYTTEYFFVKFLRLIKQIYVDPLRSNGILSPSEMEKIFSSLEIEVLIDFHTNLLIDFQSSIQNWSPSIQFSESFLRSYPFLKIYKEYCICFENLHLTLKEMKSKNDKFKNFIRNQTEGHKLELNSLDLESILVMPVQRSPRYTLLFKELLKKTPEDHPDYLNTKEAVQGSEEINQYINSNIHISKIEQKIRELEVKLKLSLFLPHRVFVREGVLIRFMRNGGMDKKIHYYLFNDLILFMKRNKIRKFASEVEIIYSLIDKFSIEEIEIVEKVNATNIAPYYKPGIIRSRFTNRYFLVSSRTSTSTEKEELFNEIKKLSGERPNQNQISKSSSASVVTSANNNDWFDEIVQAQSQTQIYRPELDADLLLFEE
eukprot:TRINITY_DN5686_c0_g1_i1.p1 TRINITY_DN5686_c0_g1~~TRINITY_DN5686_c0_g1_i1.p1  ORF type:complete len:916 (-),score=306.41 TRINITY_DN5686_c0_g1_i1:177-2924(-)